MTEEFDLSDLNALRVVDLQSVLKKRGLPSVGKKQELVARLTAALAEETKAGTSGGGGGGGDDDDDDDGPKDASMTEEAKDAKEVVSVVATSSVPSERETMATTDEVEEATPQSTSESKKRKRDEETVGESPASEVVNAHKPPSTTTTTTTTTTTAGGTPSKGTPLAAESSSSNPTASSSSSSSSHIKTAQAPPPSPSSSSKSLSKATTDSEEDHHQVRPSKAARRADWQVSDVVVALNVYHTNNNGGHGGGASKGAVLAGTGVPPALQAVTSASLAPLVATLRAPKVTSGAGVTPAPSSSSASTTGTAKNGSSSGGSSTTAAATTTTTAAATTVSAEEGSGISKREAMAPTNLLAGKALGSLMPLPRQPVPEPTKAESQVIKITGLVRPFTAANLRDYLSPHGTVEELWLNTIKTFAFVTFSSVQEAKRARDEVCGCHWPIPHGKWLSIDFATTEDVEAAKTEAASLQSAAAAARAERERALSGKVASEDERTSERVVALKGRLSAAVPSTTPAPVAEATRPIAKSRESEVSLDKLFRKTTTLPVLYYLPARKTPSAVA